MNPTSFRHLVAAVLATACLLQAGRAAADMTKEQCLDAHSRGQDAREQNKLSLARKLFLSCAQPACPQIVQGDCARFADELDQLQPSVTLVARDGAGNDLPDTTVYVDGVLVVTHLDGAMHDIDPGSHVLRFQHDGHEQTMTIVIGGGEKGRPVVATFGAAERAREPRHDEPRDGLAMTERSEDRTTHASGSKLVMWSGVALIAGGAALGLVGMLELPSTCSLSTHQCAAPPGDPAFGKASSAAQLTDAGWAVGAVGIAALGGGLLWYISSAHHVSHEHVAVQPWLAPAGGGLVVSGAL